MQNPFRVFRIMEAIIVESRTDPSKCHICAVSIHTQPLVLASTSGEREAALAQHLLSVPTALGLSDLRAPGLLVGKG